MCALVAGLAFAVGGYLGLVKSVNKLELSKPQNIETHPTYIYSSSIDGSDGPRRVIGTIFQGENRKTASLEEMPPNLLNALVAKEDERFREHGGVDVWGIMRALWVDFREGARVEGASTITQQYVKNTYLSNNRSWTRKIKEALISIEVEREYKDKDQILADYLNVVYFGNNSYGVEAAAETYFNKSVDDLTISESATLVGILWSPSTLGADRNAATDQRNLVLKKMFNAGYITNEDYDGALKQELPKTWPAAPMVQSGLTGPQLTRNFTELVQQELIDKYGSATVLNGGLNVYTSLNLKSQVAAQDTIYGSEGYIPNPGDPDAALVSIEPSTGKITAMVGNRDQSSHFNLITQAQRQPGSSFKPFALIAALEQGIDPAKTRFVSEDKVYNVDLGNGHTEKWKVKNFGKVERGSITLEEALWQSDNTVMTDLVTNKDGKGLKNGPEAIVDVAKKLGVTAHFDKHPNPSIVLGTQEVSPLDMATAYATIANGGKRVHPTAISRVVQNEGQKNEKVLYTADAAPKGEQIIKPEIAAEATKIMMGDITNGIAGKATFDDRPIAGKTGTSENFFDSWFIGFTPQLTTGVWMGYGKGGATLQDLMDPQKHSPLYDTKGSPTEIWHDYMQQVMKGKTKEKFKGVDGPPPPPTSPGYDTPPGASAVSNTPVTPTVPNTTP